MSSSDPDKQVRGRPFPLGNPGRKPGSKNRLAGIAETLIRAEEEELIRKVIELAKAGNMAALKLLLERILPRERTVELDLPEINNACDAVDASNAIIAEVAAGGISPREAGEIALLVGATARAISNAEMELRLTAIEEKLKESS
jgi:hypothetical protein